MSNREDLEALNRAQVYSEQDPFTEDRYRQFARFLRPGWEVLDVGCNTGRGGRALLQALPGVELDGTDIVAERAAKAPRDVYRAVHHQTVQQLVAHEQRYDAAILGELIEHIPYHELDSFIVSLMELVRPGGLVALTTPNPHSLLSKVKRRGILGGPHVSVHCHESLGELFAHYGASSWRALGSGKSSRYVGMHLPLACYGSYLLLVNT